MSLVSWLALLPSLYWAYWIVAKASIIEDAGAAFAGEITWIEFFRHGYSCTVCRTHWVTGALAALFFADGASAWTVFLYWSAINGIHAYSADWYDEREEAANTGPPESAGDLA